MPELLTTGCLLQCSFGVAPTPFAALELPGKPTVMGLPAATLVEIIPIDNITPFGMCSSLANPTVATATTAALGVLTPMPCLPVIPAPWSPASAIAMYEGMPLATVESMCVCAWGGEIKVAVPAETIAAVSE